MLSSHFILFLVNKRGILAGTSESILIPKKIITQLGPYSPKLQKSNTPLCNKHFLWATFVWTCLWFMVFFYYVSSSLLSSDLSS